MLSVLDTETFYIAAEVERVIKHAQYLSTQASLTIILYVTILVPSGCLVDSLDHILFKIIFIQDNMLDALKVSEHYTVQ